MDGTEKRVYRRKRALLATLLKPIGTFLDILQKQGLLTEEMVGSIRVSKLHQARFLYWNHRRMGTLWLGGAEGLICPKFYTDNHKHPPLGRHHPHSKGVNL